jgi:hypothetical protein
MTGMNTGIGSPQSETAAQETGKGSRPVTVPQTLSPENSLPRGMITPAHIKNGSFSSGISDQKVGPDAQAQTGFSELKPKQNITQSIFKNTP